MKVDFYSKDAALHYGAPSETERKAVESLVAGDRDTAERLLDEVVLEDPSRIRYLLSVLLPCNDSLLAIKYRRISQMIAEKSTSSRKTDLTPSQADIQNPPPCEEVTREQEMRKEASCQQSNLPRSSIELDSGYPKRQDVSFVEKGDASGQRRGYTFKDV